ncbi:hypothetical protein LH47_02527 [Anoxybacillus thermarum]|uniref:Uncharacterized protein n=1 Tax=Anoxybacillus thermarum TaxID=404937 RepID=A0A0D0Q5V6_9BACL|nr:hypothetical protein [Anoxybacillus thermarum]KIQ93368.1 hypothetical protein LH47_02527 [Anoxybacillus thermarum]
MTLLTLPPISEDDVLELKDYIGCGESVFGQTESKTLREFIDSLYRKCQEIEAKRWRDDPQNWGACSKWPREDDLPF